MNYRAIVLYGVYSALRTEVAKRFLGFLWWIIEPVMYMGVFYIVFELGLRQGGPDFAPFLLCGLIAWKWFEGTVRQAGSSIGMNAGLLHQIHVPKYLFALIQVLSNSFKFLIVLALLVVFLLVIGKSVTLAWLALIPVLLTQLVLIISVGFFLAAVIPFAQDLKQVVDNLLMLLMFMSGIFFSAEQVPESMRFIFELNPMVVLIAAYRSILLAGQWPQWAQLGYVLLVSAPLLLIAGLIFKRFDRHYPKLML